MKIIIWKMIFKGGVFFNSFLHFGRELSRSLGMIEIILYILLGTALIFAETLLIGGIWCVLGIISCSWGVWLAYGLYGEPGAWISAGFSILACIGAFLFWLYVLPKTRFGKSIYLTSVQSGAAPRPRFEELVGKTGVVVSPLMPSGKVKIGDGVYDAKSSEPTIDAGVEIEVVGFDSFSLTVKKVSGK